LAANRKGSRHSVSGGLPQTLPEVGQGGGVLGEPSVAEASRRHVAPRPWRTARRQLGLAFRGTGRESMPEARSPVMSRRSSRGPCRSSLAKAGCERRDLMVEGALGRRSRSLGGLRGKEILAVAGSLGMPRWVATRDKGRQRFEQRRSWRADNAHAAVEPDTDLPFGAKLDSSRPKQHQLLGRSELGWPETVNGRCSGNRGVEGWAPTRLETRTRLGADSGARAPRLGMVGFSGCS